MTPWNARATDQDFIPEREAPPPVEVRQVPDPAGRIRRVYRLGVIEVGPGYVRYWNRSASGRAAVSPEAEARYRALLLSGRYRS